MDVFGTSGEGYAQARQRALERVRHPSVRIERVEILSASRIDQDDAPRYRVDLRLKLRSLEKRGSN